MPRLDGTGPLGQGMKTGQKLGNCQISENVLKSNNEETKTETVTNNVFRGRGLGQGFGKRMGLGIGCCGRGRGFWKNR